MVRTSKLDPFKDEIQRLLEQPFGQRRGFASTLALPRLYRGQVHSSGEYLQQIRPKKKRAYIRFESAPGEQFQIDWGHLGSLTYGKTPRKLYGLAVIEAHSRLLYGEFTHSQKQDALHQALLNAFLFFGGVCSELVRNNDFDEPGEDSRCRSLPDGGQVDSRSFYFRMLEPQVKRGHWERRSNFSWNIVEYL